MPNWCFTNIEIVSNNPQKNEYVYNLIEKWTSGESYIKNDFGSCWLGNIVGFSGIDKCTDKKDFSIPCRGQLTYLELFKESIQIQTLTAWSPALKMWVMLIEKYYDKADNVKIIFTAEESSMGLLCTNDPELIDKYNVDIWDDYDNINKFLECGEYTEKDILEILTKMLSLPENCDIENALITFNRSDFRENMSIIKYDTASVDDY